MSKIHYYYDTELSQYKRVYRRSWDIIMNGLGLLLVSTGIAFLILIIFSSYIQSPRELRLKHEVHEMKSSYSELTKKVETLNVVLTSMEHRDDNIYRAVLGAEPIDPLLRANHTGLTEENTYPIDFIDKLNSEVSQLRKKLYIESLSQDELVGLTCNKEKIYAAIPAIQPISNKSLSAIASGFGLRIHPIYKVLRMHYGIDFVAPQGTSICATADGEVITVEEKFDSYGKMVVIDHGYGYTTRYGHLQDFLVKVGQRVKRGQPIGYVGNTGLSTAPHLHYEVMMRGEKIDPVNYFFNELNPMEYEKVVQLASIKNQSLGN
jgi:murein DD-endopeptidase MepM/ murein hydrolase activator NlpD